MQLPTEIADSVPLPDLTNPLDVDNIAAVYLTTIVEDSDDILCAIDLAMAMEGATAESEALEPISLAEARHHPDWLQWEAGIREELATLQAAGTWVLVDIPCGANVVGSKWVFRAKKDTAGNVVRHKAQLVTQGYSQVKGVDYFDMFAPVTTLMSIQTVLAMAARSNLELHQIDIKGVYLNGTLTNDEVIYMHQPPGFESIDHPHKVCHLRKTLYGLKQSGSIVHCFGLDELRPILNPMEPSTKLHLGQSPSTGTEYAAMRHVPYREAVSSLMYTSLTTCPDISSAVATVSCFLNNAGMPHWEAVRRIYCYLLGTKDLRLTYGGALSALIGYVDADGSMAEDCRAISGYAFFIDGGAVSWSSKKQEIISLLTMESEYVAATHAAKEALWLRLLIGELFAPFNEPTTLFSDNQSAITLTKDHQYHACTKHIDIHFHFIHWVMENGKIRLIYCPTTNMVADTLTKALPLPKVKHFAVELGLRPT